ncbi:histidinol dehydrogenase, partial [bacterium]|nr:histidinol dehydrogenase [bacterium]
MHILKTWKESDKELIEELKSRSFLDRGIEPEVQRIVEGVERHGDGAVASYTLEFDGVRLRTGEFTVKKESIDQARRQVGRRFASVLREIERNLVSYHRRQKPKDWRMDVGNGSSVGERWLPLRRVGLYVPAGKAPLVSTVLMGVVPAKVAGVKEIVVCSPPTRDGEIDPHILAACAMLGVKEVYRIGGAQAIAAMAIGTETIPRVDKIFGPGSVYVTMAKKILYGRVGIDIVAGPSEILILADESAEPAFIAADLLSQAEHGTGREVCVLVTDCDALAEKVRRELERIADGGSRTADSEIRNPKSEIPNVREESSRKDAKTQRKA